MATRSRIGIKNLDGSIESIYCHFDGYPKGVGKVLKEFYTDESKIRELLALGDISILGPELYPTKEHTFQNPEEGVTLAYGRDRGEKETESITHYTIRGFLNVGEEYNYLFQNGVWEIVQ